MIKKLTKRSKTKSGPLTLRKSETINSFQTAALHRGSLPTDEKPSSAGRSHKELADISDDSCYTYTLTDSSCDVQSVTTSSHTAVVRCFVQEVTSEDYDRVRNFVLQNAGEMAMIIPSSADQFAKKLELTHGSIRHYMFIADTPKRDMIALVGILLHTRPWDIENSLRLIDMQLKVQYKTNHNLMQSILQFLHRTAEQMGCDKVVLHLASEEVQRLQKAAPTF